MEILTTYSHETRMHNFGNFETHEFYIPPSEADRTDSAEGDYRFVYPDEKIPDNLHFDEALDSPDLIMSAGAGDISILHDLRTTPVENALNIYQTESQLVHNPPKGKRWFLILHGVDTEKFSGWEGGGPVITLWNNIYGRRTTESKSLEYAEKLKNKFGDDFKIYGYNNPDGFVRDNAEALRGASVYVNIRSRGFAPFNVGEALCTGCPVVSVPHPTVQDDIIHGYNAIISDDVCSGVEKLLKDDEMAESLSKNARNLGKMRFGLEKNLARWDYAFRLTKMLKDEGKL